MPLSIDDVAQLDANFRAVNYLSVAQLYLRENALLREPLQPQHIKARLLGHWGALPPIGHCNELWRAHRTPRGE